MKGTATKLALNVLDGAARVLGRASKRDAKHDVGVRGEEAAYFYLREQGYTVVARNYRSPRRKGEIDLIAWAKDAAGEVLCFVEVKTRSERGIKPAEQYVDYEKQRELRAMAAEYMRKLSSKKAPPRYRFDIVSIYFDVAKRPDVTLFRDAFPIS